MIKKIDFFYDMAIHASFWNVKKEQRSERFRDKKKNAKKHIL